MTGKTALLIIDMLNAFDFDEYESMLEAAKCIVGPIDHLRIEADRAEVPVIYINDNYGRWRDERSDLISYLSGDGMRGASIARALAPRPHDYFLAKPESSAFYVTALPALLPRLKITQLILTGIAADICVQFSAADAHMREYGLWVPSDAVAGSTADRVDWALGQIVWEPTFDQRPSDL